MLQGREGRPSAGPAATIGRPVDERANERPMPAHRRAVRSPRRRRFAPLATTEHGKQLPPIARCNLRNRRNLRMYSLRYPEGICVIPSACALLEVRGDEPPQITRITRMLQGREGRPSAGPAATIGRPVDERANERPMPAHRRAVRSTRRRRLAPLATLEPWKAAPAIARCNLRNLRNLRMPLLAVALRSRKT
jgi:hypothetical protein